MKEGRLPARPVLSNAFRERLQRDVLKIEALPVRDGEVLQLTFESVNSPWRQGVWLMTDDRLVVNHQQSPGVQIWQDTAPPDILIECHTKNGILHLYNVWDRGNGRNSQAWTSGMLADEIANGKRYYCNDIGLDSAFEKLIFRIERT